MPSSGLASSETSSLVVCTSSITYALPSLSRSGWRTSMCRTCSRGGSIRGVGSRSSKRSPITTWVGVTRRAWWSRRASLSPRSSRHACSTRPTRFARSGRQFTFSFSAIPRRGIGIHFGPMLPKAWPARDCKAIFYIFHVNHQSWPAEIHTINAPELQVEIDISSGQTSTTRIVANYLSGSSSIMFSAVNHDDQDALFAAIGSRHSSNAVLDASPSPWSTASLRHHAPLSTPRARSAKWRARQEPYRPDSTGADPGHAVTGAHTTASVLPSGS